MARERVGFTGNYPVIAETPLMDEFLEKDAKDAKE
jgi:L-asparagine permease